MSLIGEFFGCQNHCRICGEECDSDELDVDGVHISGNCRKVFDECREQEENVK